MKTRRISLILIGIFAATDIVAYGYSLSRFEGASLVTSHPSDRLLGHGVWRFNCQIPPGYSESHFVGMQVRRLQISDSNAATQQSVSVEGAEDLLTTAGIGLVDRMQTGTVAIQIAGRGYDPEELMFLGGLQKEGTSSKIEPSKDFFVGRLSGTSVNRKPTWNDGEMQLLRVFSRTARSKYVYDVMLEIRDKPICR